MSAVIPPHTTPHAIGEASRRSGVHIETIRYYERIGILGDIARGDNGRRSFSADSTERLTFIRRCRDLGLPLDRIRSLLVMVDGTDLTCDQVKLELDEQLQDTRQKIADLRKLEAELQSLSSSCAGGVSPDCSAMKQLFTRR